MTEKQKWSMINIVSRAGTQYGWGANGLLALLDETGCVGTSELTGEQVLAFCEKHGLEITPEKEKKGSVAS